jgi:hypothetical protein
MEGKMITIEYSKYGHPYSDFYAEMIVKSLKENDYIHTSTENIVQAARIVCLEKGIEVQFKFNDEIITPNEYGAIHNWPKGFCDYTHKWMSRILEFGMNKRKKEKLNLKE